MQVINREKTADEFDAKQEQQTLSMMSSRYASAFINDLYKKANVKDERYLFF
jgi:peptidyl-prolyl cis-trans isomerase D